MLSSALQGMRVLDLTRWLPGPFASLVLVDLGAEVIKVEQPGLGDPMREVLPSSKEGSSLFELINRGKRSISLDLKKVEGRTAFLELARHADVLLEGFRPGVMKRLGLAYDTLEAVNPRLVYASISGFGQTGPYAQRAGHDVGYLATMGFLGLNGPRDGPPTIPALLIADLSAGLWTALGVAAALLQRGDSGRGQYLDLCLLDSVTALMSLPVAEWWASGHIPRRSQMLLTGAQACYNVYETADGGHMALGALEPHFWTAFCQAMGRQDWEPRQQDLDQASLIAEVTVLFRSQSRSYWADLFAGHDCCCEPVLALDEAVAHPQVVHRGLLQDSRLATPFGPPGKPCPPAPELGQHTVQILTELGYGEDQVEALRRNGAI
jgi:alpha-methylacyl-CoA racemase